MCIQIFFWKINSCKKTNKNTNYKHSKCYLIFCYLAIKLYCIVSVGRPVCPMQCEKNILFQQVQFSSAPWPTGSSEGLRNDSAEILFQSLLQEATDEQFWHWHGCTLFDTVCLAFPLLTTALPILQDALKAGSGEAVLAHALPKPCEFPSLDTCQ